MSVHPYLFVTGAARSGSTLLTHLLNAHSQLHLAADPFLPIFRAFRDRVLEDHPPLKSYQKRPFQDFYFTAERLEMLDLILGSSLNLSCQGEGLPISELESRIGYESPDLLPYLTQLQGDTFEAVLQAALTMIGQARGAASGDWVGFKDVWIIDFLPALARSFPQAKFIVLHRDPRAILASMLNIEQTDPDQVAHSLSYLRHWRKTVALASYFQTLPLFEGRLFVLGYEDLVTQSETLAAQLCAFLGLPFDAGMLDPNRYHDYRTGDTWKGNSSFQAEVSHIDPQHTALWHNNLPDSVRKLADFVCEYEMRLVGYAPLEAVSATDPDLFSYIAHNHTQAVNWRSDLEDPAQDYGYEVFRHVLPLLPTPPQDSQLIRRAFLFTEVFDQIQASLNKEV
jgi:hypothetical protein